MTRDAVHLAPVTPENVRAICDLRVAPAQVSVHPGDGSPGPFYESLGFVLTGEVSGDEPIYARPI